MIPNIVSYPIRIKYIKINHFACHSLVIVLSALLFMKNKTMETYKVMRLVSTKLILLLKSLKEKLHMRKIGMKQTTRMPFQYLVLWPLSEELSPIKREIKSL